MGKSLTKSLVLTTIIPLMLLGVIIVAYSSRQIRTSIEGEVQDGLKNVALLTYDAYESTFPGEYKYDKENSELYKGDKKISETESLLKKHKDISKCEITIFYADMRVATTLVDEKGSPIVGSLANKSIVKEMETTKEGKLYNKTVINGKKFFTYYYPLTDDADNVIGMIATAKDAGYVKKIIYEKLVPLGLIIGLGLLSIVVLIWIYAQKIIKCTHQIQEYFNSVQKGNFEDKLSSNVTGRGDEIGVLGNSAVQMSNSLKKFIERDALTEIYNRRHGEKLLRETASNLRITGEGFYVAIGDIDFFKKFNDTYGHDCGDLVLQHVAKGLVELLGGRGEVIRWGGEEFLIVYKVSGDLIAKEVLANIQSSIGRRKVVYNGQELNVTMTFGATKGSEKYSTDELTKQADEALYEGKEGGRNRVVWYDLEEE
ncbi:diguanylate cyclase domain-containing protein [Eubacterium xylanophilum]|uniref:diguanylate cyclase domain-containing protein n=1 Tax=Eubacterium xylanophilum TaxID=39497 RepID=UPI0004B8E7A9|nr:diguanylate cyclase [Eubacterium xylanophilum]